MLKSDSIFLLPQFPLRIFLTFVLLISPFKVKADELEMVKDNQKGSYHQVELDLAIMKISKEKWRYGISKHLVESPLPLFQSKEFPQLIGNLQSSLKITPKDEIFSPIVTLKRECEIFQEVYRDLKIEKVHFEVRFNGKNTDFPTCWVKRDNTSGSRMNILLATKRLGKAKDYSYILHNFTFNYPLKINKTAIKELESLFARIQYQHSQDEATNEKRE